MANGLDGWAHTSSSSFRKQIPRRVALLVATATLIAPPAWAAALPPHDPLRILVVSDFVNPHGLSPAELTEPGDIAAALGDPASGLTIGSLVEVPTNAIGVGGADDPTAVLARPRRDPAGVDVLIYFAHRIPDDGDMSTRQPRQDDFTAAVGSYLQAGGGMVAFHHGMFAATGKSGILALIGATASGGLPELELNRDPPPYGGQRVIDVRPGHFVTANGLSYDGTDSYQDAANGVPLDDYPFFDQTPDERYLQFARNASADELTVLFASKQSAIDAEPRLLGFTHRLAGWRGVVVGWQPGEIEPNALAPANRLFQVLANAIVYASGRDRSGERSLRAVRGPGPDDVTLSWTGNRHRSVVYRSPGVTPVVDPTHDLGDTGERLWTDAPPAGGPSYYQVAAP